MKDAFDRLSKIKEKEINDLKVQRKNKAKELKEQIEKESSKQGSEKIIVGKKKKTNSDVTKKNESEK